MRRIDRGWKQYTVAGLVVVSLAAVAVSIQLPLGSGGCSGTTPQTEIEFTQTTNGTVRVTHYSGDTLPANRTFVTAGMTN